MSTVEPVKRPDLLVVVAAYNEESAIAAVVEELGQRGYHVAVVDDGSRDATGTRASAAGAVVVTHPVNLGQGAALQTGLEYGLRAGFQYLVTFDADGQHDPDDILRLQAKMVESGAEFVLGSRFLGGTIGMTKARRLLLKLAVAFTRVTTGMALSDAHNGLRLMTRKGAQGVYLRQNRMAHASEILDQIAASGLQYVECPVTIRYTDYSKAKGQSGFNSINILLDLFLQRLRK